MFRNRGNNLFDATCDDSIRAWMQMTNHRAFLRGHTCGSSSSKEELKLGTARRGGDPKKIAEVLNTLLGAKCIGIQVPHLEGEEIFGNTKQKLDVPIDDAGDSHRPDKLNFSQPRVRTRSNSTLVGLLEGRSIEAVVNTSSHVTIAFECECDMSKWYIARINHKSGAKCQAQ